MILVEFELHRNISEMDGKVEEGAAELDWAVHSPIHHSQFENSASASYTLVIRMNIKTCGKRWYKLA